MDEKVRVREKKQSSSGDKSICEHLSFAAKEAFKRLRTNVILRFPEGDDPGHVIGVTSSQPAEGKSTVSINLCYSLAELGKKVLLIDGDMRKSSIHIKLNVEKSPGLFDLMLGNNAVSTAIKKYVSSKSDTSFDIIPAGTLPSNPSEILTSSRMESLLKTVSTAYDYVIVDLPPVGVVTDAVTVSPRTDGIVYVIRENYVARGLLSDCITQLREANANIIGFVVNGALEGAGKKYGYGKGYGRSYGGYGGYGSYSGYGGYSSYYGSNK